MNLLQTLRVALRSLLRNKMRSFLTTLGIIIGIAAVIAMVALGEGVKQQVDEAFAAMGSNLLIILPGTTTSGGAHGGFGSMPTLTWDDLKAIQTEVPTVKYAAPLLRTAAQVLSEDQNWTTSVNGTTPDYFRIRNWPVALGVGISPSDVDGDTKVVVLGQTVVNQLFGPNANPVGQYVRIKDIPFQVIGVLSKKGQSSFGQDYDDAVFVPDTTFQTKIQGGLHKYIGGIIFVGATSSDATARAETEIASLLRDRHHLQPGTEDDFSIRNLTEMATARSQNTALIAAFLAAIAGISLLVGGIGIMNIMLVSVTERTREIGVRMAVGAKPHNIQAQFLVEALALSSAGGLIGIVLGIVGARILAGLVHWPLLIRSDIIVVSVLFSALVGVVFGFYPAQKASRLDPIEALRFE